MFKSTAFSAFFWASVVHVQPKFELCNARLKQCSFSLKKCPTWGLPSASSCSSKLFLARVTSPSNLSYSLHDRSNSWCGRDTLCEWQCQIKKLIKQAGKNSPLTSTPDYREPQWPAWVCVNALYDSRLWLWKALYRCWAGRSAVSHSAGWHSAWQQGYQSPSLSPGWLTAVLSPECAEGTHNISNTLARVTF